MRPHQSGQYRRERRQRIEALIALSGGSGRRGIDDPTLSRWPSNGEKGATLHAEAELRRSGTRQGQVLVMASMVISKAPR
jgi:hypothetical protein